MVNDRLVDLPTGHEGSFDPKALTKAADLQTAAQDYLVVRVLFFYKVIPQ
jgi:hypothetical protein